jgi:hypothetical protein
MTLRTNLVRLADRVRALTGPAHLDQRPHQLTIITREWSGGYKEAGVPTDALLALPPHFLVRQVSTREVASSGGRYELGDVAIENITPEYVDPRDGQTKGFSPNVLSPSVARNGIEIIYRISGPHAGDYQLVELQSWRPYAYRLLLRRRLDTP